MNINKMAQQDAFNRARAEMFFGEGAGVRRKLLNAEISHKMATIPGYIEKYNESYFSQNFADHAVRAAKERKHLDRSGIVKKHTKALLRGDRRNEIAGLVIVGIYIHQKGYDKAALEKAKQVKHNIKSKIDERKLRNGGKLL